VCKEVKKSGILGVLQVWLVALLVVVKVLALVQVGIGRSREWHFVGVCVVWLLLMNVCVGWLG